jgi:excisionase family DNA binding protein
VDRNPSEGPEGLAALTIDVPDSVLDAIAATVADRVVERLALPAVGSSSPWMTVEEAADYSRIKLGTFKHLVSKGRIRTHEMPLEEGRSAKNKLIHRDELDHDLGYLGGGGESGRPVHLRRANAA